MRRRNALKEANSAARIERLESKLDSLASLLQPTGQSSQMSIDLREASEEQYSGSVGDAAGLRNQETLRSTTTPAPSSSSVPIDQASVEEVEGFLRVFRDTMLPSFAFVHIHPSMTVGQLRNEKPFFFQAIVAVASPTIQQKLVHGTELKRYLAQRMLMENHSSIDLLLGLLTYIAWSFDHFLNKTANLSRFMQLAMSVVFDLRLNKPEPAETQKGLIFHSQGYIEHKSEQNTNDSHSLEKERAVLGCFLLSAVYAKSPSFRVFYFIHGN